MPRSGSDAPELAPEEVSIDDIRPQDDILLPVFPILSTPSGHSL